jgi:hypothetical protein
VGRVAGAAYLGGFGCVVFAQFGIHDKLIVEGNAAETARNLLAHEGLYRAGMALDLVYCVAMVVWIAALYVIFRPVGRALSMLAALWRMVYVVAWVLMTLNLFVALRLFAGGESLQGAAMRALGARFDQYYVGLLFCGLASTACAYLWLRSGYIPRALAGFGVVASAFCAGCTFVFLIYPGFEKIVNLWWFDTPMGIFDLVVSGWILVRGIRAERAA